MKIYVDNAATTKMSQRAIQAMMPYLDGVYGNPSSLHTYGQEAAEALENAREAVAKAIGAEANEIYFTSGGTEADNQAILTGAILGERKGKKHIISSKFEHHAVLNTLKQLEKQGFTVTLLEVYENGLVRLEDVKQAIREDTGFVTIMMANNEIGTIQPIREIGALCRERGILFHTDAVQAVGHIPVDVKELKVDLLSLSGHKFHGPKGVGALYVRKSVPLQKFITGGAQERGKRAGTENIPGIVAMAEALQESIENLSESQNHILSMRDRLIEKLREIPHSKVNGDLQYHLPGTVNMCFEGIEGESMLLLLDAKGIAASSGSACTSGSLDPSHVLLALGLPHEVAHGSLRLSLDAANTQEEVTYICEVLPEVVAYLRSISPVWEELEKGKRKHVI